MRIDDLERAPEIRAIRPRCSPSLLSIGGSLGGALGRMVRLRQRACSPRTDPPRRRSSRPPSGAAPGRVPVAAFVRSGERRLGVRVATELGGQALESALRRSGLTPTDVDHFFFTTVTGIASPTIDVKLINQLGMRADVKRTPMFGLGCVGGAAGTARAADYLRGFPDQIAVLLSVELCSLTLKLGDRSLANVISTALFGDGAAAVVLSGAGCTGDPSGPRILASRSLSSMIQKRSWAGASTTAASTSSSRLASPIWFELTSVVRSMRSSRTTASRDAT